MPVKEWIDSSPDELKAADDCRLRTSDAEARGCWFDCWTLVELPAATYFYLFLANQPGVTSYLPYVNIAVA